jgi:hypothetical protein
MSANNFDELYRHYGHQVVVAQYTDSRGEGSQCGGGVRGVLRGSNGLRQERERVMSTDEEQCDLCGLLGQ